MKIVFDKVGSKEKPFKHNQNGVFLEGTLKRENSNKVTLKALFSGKISLTCDRCAVEYIENINNNLELELYNKVVQDEHNLDIFEFLDGIIDISYILESEVNTIEGAYHYCPKCTNSEEALEIEI